MKSWDQKRNLHGGMRKKLVPNFMGVDVMYAIENLVKDSRFITKTMKRLLPFIQIEITMRSYTKIFGLLQPNFSLYAIDTIIPLRISRSITPRHSIGLLKL